MRLTSISILMALTLFTQSVLSSPELSKSNFFKKVMPKLTDTVSIKIPDPISDKPINTVVYKALDKDRNILGYIREVKTTTGCDSACLPVVFTLFYSKEVVLKKLKSHPGLTKKFHAPFLDKDYDSLDVILMLNPSIFQTVKHPTEMVDGLTGATKKEFVPHVVKDAAYTSLRVNLYHQQTLKFLKSLK